MKKLYALEDNLETGNDLLIDKVLAYSEKKVTPISVTADVIKQRQELKSEIKDKLNADEEEKKDDNPDDSSNNTDNSNNDSNDSNTDENSDDKSKTDNNDSSIGDDKDSINSIIGSGLNEDSDSGSGNVAEESLTTKSTIKLNNVFAPIKTKYNNYLVSLENFNVPFKLAIEEQPIVYVKDSVLESLNNLVTIANIYIGKNKTFIDDNSESIKNINERLTVTRQFIENRKYHFTNKLINDNELLSNLSVTDKSNLRETSKYLVKYLENSSKFVNFILNNKFEDISSGLSNSEFVSENGDFAYKDMLPGFNLIRVHLDNYTNYLKTNIEEFHYYKLRIFKTENLYNLEAISITEDKEIDYLMSSLDKLLIDLSLTVDNFNVVNNNLNKLIDELKVIIYDVEKDKYTNLANIDIDTKVKDFIRFKLVSETYYINISLLLSYILNSISVINNCVELKP